MYFYLFSCLQAKQENSLSDSSNKPQLLPVKSTKTVRMFVNYI